MYAQDVEFLYPSLHISMGDKLINILLAITCSLLCGGSLDNFCKACKILIIDELWLLSPNHSILMY